MFNENCTATVQEKNTKNVQAIETPYIFAQIPRKHFAKKCFYSVKKNTQIMHGKQTWTHIPSKNLGLPQQNSFSRKIAKFREKVCGIHKKICAFFFKESLLSLKTLSHSQS